MNTAVTCTTEALRSPRFYHCTRTGMKPGDLTERCDPAGRDERSELTSYVLLTPNLDAAIWGAELAAGDDPGRVYIVEPVGQIEDISDLTDRNFTGHPSMSCRS